MLKWRGSLLRGTPMHTVVLWLYWAHRRLETVRSAVLGSFGAIRGLPATCLALMGSPSLRNWIGRSSTLANALLYVLQEKHGHQRKPLCWDLLAVRHCGNCLATSATTLQHRGVLLPHSSWCPGWTGPSSMHVICGNSTMERATACCTFQSACTLHHSVCQCDCRHQFGPCTRFWHAGASLL